MLNQRMCEVDNCSTRQYVSLAVNGLAMLFVLFACVQTYRRFGQMKFEVMPMTLNLLATILITFLCVVRENYEYNLVIIIVEIYTYFFFTFSFGMVLVRLRSDRSKCAAR